MAPSSPCICRGRHDDSSPLALVHAARQPPRLNKPDDKKVGTTRLTRAGALLRDGLVLHADGRTAFADALGVTIESIDSFATGRAPMPLDAQGRLAAFIIEHVPALARMGHRLQAQVVAATDFHDGRTTTHRASPPRR
jgi:hypothetical protein